MKQNKATAVQSHLLKKGVAVSQLDEGTCNDRGCQRGWQAEHAEDFPERKTKRRSLHETKQSHGSAVHNEGTCVDQHTRGVMF
jgi:hypothetical protein